MLLGWNDQSDLSKSSFDHELAAGVDIPFVAPQGTRIRLDWGVGGPGWYSDSVEGGNDHQSIWPVGAATQTPVRATLTIQQVPNADNAYLGVLYLVDQTVPVPGAVGAIVRGYQPAFPYAPPAPQPSGQPGQQPEPPAAK